MKRDAKDATTRGILRTRGSLAVRAALGSLLLLCALVLTASGVQASKVVYDFFPNPTPSPSPTGDAADGGLLNSPRGVAVNVAGVGGAGAGDVYVVNGAANRIDQFDAKGNFIRAFGRDVIETGKANDNATGFEICDVTAGNAPADCKAGATAPAEGGTLSNPQGVAVDQASGHVYVSNQALLRVEQFDATGHFVRAFGQDVVSAGPGNSPAIAAKQTLAVDATAGQFKLSFRGQTTADLGFDATAAQVDAALEALNTVGAGNVGVTGGPGGAGGLTPYVITFAGTLNNAPMPLIGTAAGTTPLSGGAGASVVSTTTGSTGYEICNAPADTCKAGVSASTAGALATNLTGQLAVAPVGAPNAGNVLVASPGSRRVNEYTATGAVVRSFGFDVTASPPNATTTFEICSAAGFDVCKIAAASGTAVGQFGTNGPNRVAVDQTGAVYTVERANPNFRVQKFTAAGASLTPALFNPAIGVAPAAFLSGSGAGDAPADVAVGASGTVFVTKTCAASANCPGAAVSSERRVYEFSSAGNLVDTHAANAGITDTNGLAVNPVIDRLYVSSAGETPGSLHRVYILTNPPGTGPVVTTGASTPGSRSYLRTLEGTVNPNGFKVEDCHFEYGETAEYGETTPCVPAEPGEGTGDVAVSAETEPLKPNTVYHYRLFAANVALAEEGKDRVFTTGPGPADACPNAGIRAGQPAEVALLPECMALEQVSPSNKGNQPARLPGAVSVDGERVRFNSLATIGDTPNVNGLSGDDYIATRGTSGWEIKGVNPLFSTRIGGVSAASYSPDLTRWFYTGSGQFFEQDLNGLLLPFSPPLTNLRFLGASGDRSQLYFRPGGNFDRTGFYLPGDPQPAGSGEDSNLYVTHLDDAGQPVLELLARDRDGKAWGGNCGARLGGMEDTTGANLNLENGVDRNQGAISADGDRVYFSTRPAQPESGSCTEANKKRIMVREETPTGPLVEELIASECDRVAPACSGTDGDDVYQGASVDQSRVYFTTTRQLADTDLDGGASSCSIHVAVAGCDLYLYDSNLPLGQRLIQVSAGDSSAPTPGQGASVRNSITAISADGSHAYFVAQSVLTTDPNPEDKLAQAGQSNLYLYEHDLNLPIDDRLAFVGTLDSLDGGVGENGRPFGGEANWDNGAYAVPISGAGGTGGDGHVLVFRTKAALTSDDADAARDLYRYDAEAGTLELLSGAVPGAVDGAVDVRSRQRVAGPGTDYAERGRWVSEDGQTVVFTTRAPLLPGDVNGVEDDYLWRDGELFRLPGSAGPDDHSPVLSHDGSTVAYHSSRQLLPSDGDSVNDVYVARANGGYPPPPPPPGCTGETCQGPPPPAPNPPGAATQAATSGNVKEPARCRKGHVRKKGKCVKKRQGKGKRRNAGSRGRAGK